MKVKNVFILSAVCLLLLMSGLVSAQEKDIQGSKDHPLISRYPGSVIGSYVVREYDEYMLPLGNRVEKKDWNYAESRHLEGKITRIQYVGIPEGRSTLEVYRNYENALKKAGFEILFAGKGEELGHYWPQFLLKDTNPLPDVPNFLPASSNPQQRHLSARLARPEGDVYVSLLVTLAENTPVAHLDIIEIKPMETDLIKVNAAWLAEDIARTGHVALYGIYFETDKAEIKAESKPVIAEIAKMLKQAPKLKLYLVGHTDNVGEFEYNMNLSQKRAEAVVNALVSEHGIDASRLKAQGVGPLVPVSTNETEEGRARNRRVELVKQ
jgi:OOP family OmpA-OmpF porin